MFDRSYFAEYQTVTALRSQGLETIHWLPPAYYENLFRPLGITQDMDFAFVGQSDDTVVRRGLTRKQFMEKLVGQVHNGRLLSGAVKQGIYGETVNVLYNRSKVLLDRTIYNNVGTRMFETVGSGGFVLANRGKVSSGIDQLAIDGHHFVSYNDSYWDFIDKLGYYLDHDDERRKIAAFGHAHFLKNHTYANRLRTILDDFGLCSCANSMSLH
jgi:hypothetical protein